MQNNKQRKSEIRKQIRQNRNNLSANEKASAGESLASLLLKKEIINKKDKVACFLSFDGEISTHAIIHKMADLDCQCFLPKLRPLKPNRLWFMPFSSASTMTNNRLGISEVDLPVNNALPVSKLDIVLLPLVAFDKQGNRLGMGGGFYDATFAHLRESDNRPLFIGLAHEFQMVEQLPSDPWDLPLDGVCTDKSFYQF